MQPLHVAAWRGHAAIIEALVVFCDDIEITDVYDRTALMIGVIEQQIDCVRLLLQLDAITTKTDRYGLTPARNTNNEAMKALLKEYESKSVSW